MNAATRWVWADVGGETSGDVTHLRHLADGTTLTVVGGRLIRGPCYQYASREVRRQLARVGAIIRLRQLGKYYLHASGAVAPNGGAWLLTGDTGAGKSTLAFALSHAGWRILGDDGVIVEHRAHAVVAHPWNEPLRVSTALSKRYPVLTQTAAAPLPNDERKRVPVRGARARSTAIAGIVLLEHAPDHRFHRAARDIALGALVRQSPWVLIDDALAVSHYRALHRLVEAVPVFHLRHSAAQLGTIARTLLEAA